MSRARFLPVVPDGEVQAATKVLFCVFLDQLCPFPKEDVAVRPNASKRQQPPHGEDAPDESGAYKGTTTTLLPRIHPAELPWKAAAASRGVAPEG